MVNDNPNEEIKRVDISEKKVLNYLDALKKTHKITKKGYSDAITKLVELHEADEKVIRKLKRENEQLSQNANVTAPTVITPQTEAPKDSSEVTEPTALIEPVKVGGQQCYYHTFNHKKQLVGCMRKYEKYDVIEPVTQQICDKCWAQNPYKKYPIPNSQITDENQSLKGVSETSEITSDVPLGMAENPEKQKAIQELKEEATKPLPLPPCYFVGEGYIDKKHNIQIVFCRDPKKIPKGKKYIEFPFSICYSCWKAKEWGKKKREREQENNAEQEQAAEPKPRVADFPPCENITSRQTRSPNDPLTEFPIGTKLVYCRDKGEWKTSEQCLKCVEDESPDMSTAETEETEE